jgi:hypothetical protein
LLLILSRFWVPGLEPLGLSRPLLRLSAGLGELSLWRPLGCRSQRLSLLLSLFSKRLALGLFELSLTLLFLALALPDTCPETDDPAKDAEACADASANRPAHRSDA